MFEKISKSPIMQIVLIACTIVIIIAVFSPRKNDSVLSAGLNINARVGRLQGGINLETFESNKPSLVLFYAPWCGHCKRFMPTFDKFKKSYSGKADVVAVNCDENKEIAKKHNIQGFPTIRYYQNGTSHPSKFVEHSGERSVSGLTDFINQNS